MRRVEELMTRGSAYLHRRFHSRPLQTALPCFSNCSRTCSPVQEPHLSHLEVGAAKSFSQKKTPLAMSAPLATPPSVPPGCSQIFGICRRRNGCSDRKRPFKVFPPSLKPPGAPTPLQPPFSQLEGTEQPRILQFGFPICSKKPAFIFKEVVGSLCLVRSR